VPFHGTFSSDLYFEWSGSDWPSVQAIKRCKRSLRAGCGLLMAVILGYTKWYELSLSYVSVTVWLKIIEIARRRHRIFSVSGDNAKISKYNAADKASWDATADLLGVSPHEHHCSSFILYMRLISNKYIWWVLELAASYLSTSPLNHHPYLPFLIFYRNMVEDAKPRNKLSNSHIFLKFSNLILTLKPLSSHLFAWYSFFFHL